MNRSSNVSTGTSTRAAQRLDELGGRPRLLAVLTAQRERHADDDPLRTLLSDQLDKVVEPWLGSQRLDDANRARERARRIRDGDAGPR